MSDFGLPEPVRELTEVNREQLRWNRESCQPFVDAHLPLFSLDEQRVIFDEVMEAVHSERPLLMYVDGISGRGKTLMKVITATVRAEGMELNLCQKYSYCCKLSAPHLVYPDIRSPYFCLCPDLRICSPQSLFKYTLRSPYSNIHYCRACIYDQSSEYSLHSPHSNIRCRSLRS